VYHHIFSLVRRICVEYPSHILTKYDPSARIFTASNDVMIDAPQDVLGSPQQSCGDPRRQEFLISRPRAATVAQNCVTRDTASTISNWRLLDNETRRKAAMGGFPLKKKNEIDGLTKHRDQHASVLRHFSGPARGIFFREARLPRLEVLFSRNEMLVFSIGDSLSRLFFAVSTDVEFDSCGICVVSPHSRSMHLSVYFGVYFLKEKKLNQTI
jgi:hypothetical protein